MYQSYEEKVKKVMETIKTFERNALVEFPKISSLSLNDYHEIIARDNVIVVDYPKFPFDLITMSVTQPSPSSTFTGANLLVFEVQTHAVKDLSEIEWKDDTLYFFYTGSFHGENFLIRRTSIPKEIIIEAIEHFESSKRIASNLNANRDVQSVRDYVNSETFEKDVKIIKKDFIKEIFERVQAWKQENKLTEGLNYC